MEIEKILEIFIVLINVLGNLPSPVYLEQNRNNHPSLEEKNGAHGNNIYAKTRTAVAVRNHMAIKCGQADGNPDG